MPHMQNRSYRRAGAFLAFLLCFAVMLAACSKPAEQSPASQASQAAKRFHLVGKIISVNTANNSLTIDHQAIPGFMDAMTMAYTVHSAQDMTGLGPGDEITADVVVPDVGTLYIENIMVTKKGSGATPVSGAAPSSELHEPQPGERVPDFAFINQDGKRIHLSSFRGDALLVTFIYTRCPYPEYCPLVSKNFAQVYASSRSSAPASSKIRLLSVSFDPQHDTPAVLKQYAETFRKSAGGPVFDRWEFVAAPPAELKSVANFFGLYFSESGGQIVHSMSTTVISPDGTVSKWYRDNQWAPADLLADANAALSREPESAATIARAQVLTPVTSPAN